MPPTFVLAAAIFLLRFPKKTTGFRYSSFFSTAATPCCSLYLPQAALAAVPTGISRQNFESPPQHAKKPTLWVGFFGASSGIRTPDTLLKRQVLYLLS